MGSISLNQRWFQTNYRISSQSCCLSWFNIISDFALLPAGMGFSTYMQLMTARGGGVAREITNAVLIGIVQPPTCFHDGVARKPALLQRKRHCSSMWLRIAPFLAPAGKISTGIPEESLHSRKFFRFRYSFEIGPSTLRKAAHLDHQA